MRRKTVIFSVFHILFIVYIFLCSLLNINNLTIVSLQYILVVLFIENVVLSFIGKYFNLYQIFLGTSFLFIYSRIFLDMLGFCDFRVLNLWENSYMTEQEAKLLLLTIIVFLVATSIAWLFYIHFERLLEPKTQFYFEHLYLSKLGNIIQIVFYILIILNIIKSLIIIRLVQIHGYLFLFDGRLQTYPFPFILRVQTIIEIIFPILLFYRRDFKSFKRNIVLYLIYLAIKLLTGQRGPTFVSLLLILWIFSTYYKRINMLKLSMIGMASIGLIQFILWFREGYSSNSSIVFSLLYSQGISLLVISGTIRHLNVFTNKIPFILGYFVDFFTITFNKQLSIGQNLGKLQYGNYLNDHLTYALSPEKYLIGNGTGTAMIAEFYEFVHGDLILLFVISFIFMLCVLLISNLFYKNIFTYVFIYYILYYFIYSPRDSVFKSIKYIVFSFPFIIFFKFIEIKKYNQSIKMEVPK